MAGRSYSRFTVATWADLDWRALSSGAQRLYMLILSQPTLTAAGCLPRQPRKWATLAADTTQADIEEKLDELTAARYVLVDDDTEEVLVRTFIRHDGWVSNPRRAKAVESAVARIESARLRGHSEAELAACRPKAQHEGPDEGPSEGPTEGQPVPTCSQQPAYGIQNPAAQQPEVASADEAIDLFADWRCAQGDVHNPGGLRKTITRDDLPRVAAWLTENPTATAVDAAVMLGMPRPRHLTSVPEPEALPVYGPPMPPKPAVSLDEHKARLRERAEAGDADAAAELSVWEKPGGLAAAIGCDPQAGVR